MGLSLDKMLMNIERYAVATAGTIPLLLLGFENNLKSDNIIISAFGGGFTWGSIWIKMGL